MTEPTYSGLCCPDDAPAHRDIGRGHAARTVRAFSDATAGEPLTTDEHAAIRKALEDERSGRVCTLEEWIKDDTLYELRRDLEEAQQRVGYIEQQIREIEEDSK